MNEIAVRAEGVSKRFRKGEQYDSLRDLIPALTGETFRRKTLSDTDDREFWALEEVSFEVMKGEAFGIIGHNGAGKSTMLKILSQIMQPTCGTVRVAGRLSALIEVSAGFHRDLTGRENIYLNGTILGMSRAEIDAKLEAIVEFSGLADFIDTPVKRYSSGMFARLGFSVAAHVDPDVLIVDEVLSVGDFVFQQKCIARMREVIRRGTSVLFVSHNLRAIGELCTRGMLLQKGRVSEVGGIDSVINAYMTNARGVIEAGAVGKPRITAVTIRQNDQDTFQIESGDSVCVDVDIETGQDCKNVAVVLYFTDEKNYEFFNTSTERLGHPSYDLKAGDSLRCRFKLDMNMAAGTYQVGAVLFRYHTQTVIDKPAPHCRFFIKSKSDASRGIIDCNPSLVDSNIKSREGTDSSLDIGTGND